MRLDWLAGRWHVVGKAGSSLRYMAKAVVVDGKRRTLLQHRVVMELAHSRTLERSEHVHHRDGDGLNNEPSNLLVLGAGEHIKLHAKDHERRVNIAWDQFDMKTSLRRAREEHLRFLGQAAA